MTRNYLSPSRACILSRSSVDMEFVASKLPFLFLCFMTVSRGEEGKLVKILYAWKGVKIKCDCLNNNVSGHSDIVNIKRIARILDCEQFLSFLCKVTARET